VLELHSGDGENKSKPLKKSETQLNSVTKFIMIVDDEQDILDLFRDYLQLKGLKVRTYADPLEALSEIQVNQSSYSLIITDIRMPQMNGIEFIQRVRKINRNIKVIFMTAFDIEKEKIKEANKAELLRKPVSLENLRTSVINILESRS
jgi:DNA-binding response OmpR family regulator